MNLRAVRSIFSTRDQRSKTDDYFLRSGNAISFFFEEEAFGPDGSLQQDKALSINKVGHALHDLDPVFRRFSRSPRMAAVMRSLGFRRPVPAQSMYIFKQPGIGGEVVPHQDRREMQTRGFALTSYANALLIPMHTCALLKRMQPFSPAARSCTRSRSPPAWACGWRWRITRGTAGACGPSPAATGRASTRASTSASCCG